MIYCDNPECPEYRIAKDNPMGFPPEVIVCGGCGEGCIPVPEGGDYQPGQQI